MVLLFMLKLCPCLKHLLTTVWFVIPIVLITRIEHACLRDRSIYIAMICIMFVNSLCYSVSGVLCSGEVPLLDLLDSFHG